MPDIGDFSDVPVIDVFVKVGDTIKVDDALVTLESDKATMDVPSSVAGVVKEVKVKLGDKVSEGAVVVIVEPSGGAPWQRPRCCSACTHTGGGPAPAAAPRRLPLPRSLSPPPCRSAARPTPAPRCAPMPASSVPTSPGQGHRPEGTHPQEDVTAFVKGVLTAPPAAAGGASLGGGLDLLPGRRSTSPSSARSRRSRCRASRKFPARTCRATGS